jgi:hypothetical protein
MLGNTNIKSHDTLCWMKKCIIEPSLYSTQRLIAAYYFCTQQLMPMTVAARSKA